MHRVAIRKQSLLPRMHRFALFSPKRVSHAMLVVIRISQRLSPFSGLHHTSFVQFSTTTMTKVGTSPLLREKRNARGLNWKHVLLSLSCVQPKYQGSCRWHGAEDGKALGSRTMRGRTPSTISRRTFPPLRLFVAKFGDGIATAQSSSIRTLRPSVDHRPVVSGISCVLDYSCGWPDEHSHTYMYWRLFQLGCFPSLALITIASRHTRTYDQLRTYVRTSAPTCTPERNSKMAAVARRLDGGWRVLGGARQSSGRQAGHAERIVSHASSKRR